MIGTRRVSFIIYLTEPDEGWTAEDGGMLELYPLTEARRTRLPTLPPTPAHAHPARPHNFPHTHTRLHPAATPPAEQHEGWRAGDGAHRVPPAPLE